MLLGQRFETLREAGSGGMGVVYEAHDRVTGQKVAVKVLGDRTHALRFEREAEVLSRLEHPGIVRYVAHGAASDAAPAWIAMEWLEGEDLATRLARGPLTVDESIALASRIADAVGAAHAGGFIHRDLKPTNVFLVHGRLDEAKVLDFGLARETTPSADRRPLTVVGMVLGSVGYLAPEQARGATNVDARVDVFALGSILYECLTGKPAFSGAHAVAILAKLLVEDAPRVRASRPEVPAALDALVARMLERSPDRRPTDGFAARDALARLGDASNAPRSTALTREEQRVMAVILVAERRSSPSFESDSSTSQATMVSFGATGAASGLAEAIAPFDVTLDAAADGTLVVAMRGGGGTEQAVRAARCALVIRAAYPGPVVALALGTGATTAGGGPVAGEVIERAAALLSAATRDVSGGVVVEREAAALLEQRFVLAPVACGLLLQAERTGATSARLLLGRVTPFVGRARELTTLEHAFATAVTDSQSTALVVVGEAGSGKSRLREELLRAARRRAPDVVVWSAQGDALRAQSPFNVAAALLRNACESPDGPRDLRRFVAETAGVEGERVAMFLGEMAGEPRATSVDPALALARESLAVMQDQIARAWIDFVGACVSRAPLLIVVDDLHWTDAPTIELLDKALAAHGERPLVVVALGRPAALESFPRLWSAHGAQTIHLAPLSGRAAEKLVRQSFAGADDQLVLRLVDRAAGNPFVLEELIRSLAEHDDDASLPMSVLALVQSRLEMLDPAVRRVLRAASVFGRNAHAAGVARLVGDDGVVPSALRVLVEREVLEPVENDPTLFRFRHDLVRDAAYAMLTPADRTTGHALAGAWLEEAGEHDASVLAMHHDMAGDVERATLWHVRAAEQALEGHTFQPVADHVARAIELGVSGPLRGRALYARAVANEHHGDCVTGLEDARAAVADFTPGTADWYAAILEACKLGDVVGERAAVSEIADMAIDRAAPEDDRARSLRMRILSQVATIRFHMGDHAGCDALAARLEAEAAPLMASSPLVALGVHYANGMRASFAQDPYAELQQWLRIREIHQSMSDRRGATAGAINAGYAWMQLGVYARAEADLRDGMRLAEEMRLTRAAAAARHNLGLVLACQGRLEDALREEVAALRVMEEARDERLTATSRVYLAMIQEMAGDLETAELTARRALAETANLPPLVPRAHAALGRVLMRRGAVNEAAALAEQLAASLRGARIEGGDVYPRLVLAEILLGGLRTDEAATVLRDTKAAIDRAAAHISDDTVRAHFLEDVPENARALELARELGVG